MHDASPEKKEMSKALIRSSFFRASEAGILDCFGARAPRNDGMRLHRHLTVIASGAKQSSGLPPLIHLAHDEFMK
jgi:hypothetical protein